MLNKTPASSAGRGGPEKKDTSDTTNSTAPKATRHAADPAAHRTPNRRRVQIPTAPAPSSAGKTVRTSASTREYQPQTLANQEMFRSRATAAPASARCSAAQATPAASSPFRSKDSGSA